jgi:perosamine synthetase
VSSSALNTQLADQIIDSISDVIGPGPAGLHEPKFHGNEWLYLKECLDTTYVSSVGSFVEQFENDLARYTGAKHAISVINGTSALHIALLLAGVKKDDEVLIPDLTFVATANAVAYCNAVPHFVDSEEITLGIDTAKLRDYLNKNTEKKAGFCVNKITGRIIRTLVPMHTFGHPVDVEGCLSIAKDFNLTLVEDAAESLGSFYQEQHTGTFGLLGILSFNGNKTITSGGGGAILTNDSSLAKHAKHLTTTARTMHDWEYRHNEVGYNYRLPNLNAALGCAQLEQLPLKLKIKRELTDRYRKAFSLVSGVKLVSEPANCFSNYWLQALLLDKEDIEQRDFILAKTNEAGFMTRPVWTLMHELEPFKNNPKMDVECAISLSKRLINFPSNSIIREVGSA